MPIVVMHWSLRNVAETHITDIQFVSFVPFVFLPVLWHTIKYFCLHSNSDAQWTSNSVIEISRRTFRVCSKCRNRWNNRDLYRSPSMIRRAWQLSHARHVNSTHSRAWSAPDASPAGFQLFKDLFFWKKYLVFNIFPGRTTSFLFTKSYAINIRKLCSQKCKSTLKLHQRKRNNI